MRNSNGVRKMKQTIVIAFIDEEKCEREMGASGVNRGVVS